MSVLMKTQHFILCMLLALLNAVEFDIDSTQEEISTFSVQNILYGILGLIAIVTMSVALLWKCVVSPTLDATWSTITSALWIAAISLILSIFTLMLWFIT